MHQKIGKSPYNSVSGKKLFEYTKDGKKPCFKWNREFGCNRSEEECGYGYWCAKCGNRNHERNACQKDWCTSPVKHNNVNTGVNTVENSAQLKSNCISNCSNRIAECNSQLITGKHSGTPEGIIISRELNVNTGKGGAGHAPKLVHVI